MTEPARRARCLAPWKLARCGAGPVPSRLPENEPKETSSFLSGEWRVASGEQNHCSPLTTRHSLRRPDATEVAHVAPAQDAGLVRGHAVDGYWVGVDDCLKACHGAFVLIEEAQRLHAI